jgi:hypothetical protein
MVSLDHSTQQKAAEDGLISFLFQGQKDIVMPDWKALPCKSEAQGTCLELPVFYWEGSPNEPHLFYLPSEYDTLDSLFSLFEALKLLDFSIFYCDYSALWRKAPHLSIEAMCEAITHALQSVSAHMEQGSRNGPLTVMGRSIGSAFAIHSAACMSKRTACLVVESGFANTADLLQKMGKNTLELSEDPFSNRAKMRTYTKPVLFLHSSRDEYTTLTQVEWLVMESRSKATQFQVVPSPSRNNLFGSTSEFYLQALKDFIYLRMGRRPKLKRHLNKMN